MISRQLFPKLKLFKKEATERFLVVTREIYRHHPVYTYADREEETEILIYPSYADVDYDGKQPRIIGKAGSYNYHLMDTMNNNMAREVFKGEVMVGHAHSQIIPISMTFLIRAYAEEESSDLADEFVSLVVFACRKMYGEVGLIIRGTQVSETDVIDQEQDIYQTSVSVSLDIPWSTEMTDTGSPIDITSPEFDYPSLEFDVYRPPGVNVVRLEEKKTDY